MMSFDEYYSAMMDWQRCCAEVAQKFKGSSDIFEVENGGWKLTFGISKMREGSKI